MKLTDIVYNADNIIVDDLFVSQVEDIYGCKLPDFVRHILCIPVNDSNYEEAAVLYKLSNDMILGATEEMRSDFIGNHLLPLFDCSDNDYLCYDYSGQCWCMHNIADDSTFNRHTDILELL